MLLTVSLLMAVLVAVTAQFLVGYNLGVMNAPSKVVFPSHTTVEWSIAVSAFAIGGPRKLPRPVSLTDRSQWAPWSAETWPTTGAAEAPS